MALIVEFATTHLVGIILAYLFMVGVAVWGLKRDNVLLLVVTYALALPLTILMWTGVIGQISVYARQIWP